ncbi:MAG: FecR domain-containing protein [Akkermansiaceae bacterium]|nr:FecR domain-containing protein [Verrucomicrobiales bacterium]
MSAPDATRFEALLSRHLDDCLEEPEQDELFQCLSDEKLAARFLEMMKLDAEIAGLSAVPVPDTVMAELVLSDLRDEAGLHAPLSPRSTKTEPIPMANTIPFSSRPTTKSYSRRVLALAAMLIGLLTLSALYFSEAWRSNQKAEVASVSGEVYFINESGQVRLMSEKALKKDGKLQTVGPDSRATLMLADGTRVDVGGDSSLVTELDRGKRRIHLEKGTLDSKIVKQPDDLRLTFCTAEAEATVRGTRLRLKRWNFHTLLIVTEGEVLLRRPTDGRELIVTAGFHAEIKSKNKFELRPNSRLPELHR